MKTDVKRLKIGMFCDTFYPTVDGVVKVVDNYARILSRFCDVTVFVPYGRKKFSDDFPYKVVRCERFRVLFIDYDLPVPRLDRRFMAELDKSDLDIVHLHSPFTIGKVGLQYAKKRGIPCVATMHSQFKRDFQRALKPAVLTRRPMLALMMYRLRSFFNSTTVNWAVNKEVARIFHEEYGVARMPEIMPNGTDMRYVSDKELLDCLRKKYDIAQGCRVLLFVGRINLLKNVHFLVRSLAVLKQKGFSFKAIMVGTGQDYDTVRHLIRKNGLENDVMMTGKISDRNLLAAHYALADLFTFPSMYDASSLVQIEAASQRTPSLFLEGSATSATVTPEVDGYLSEADENAYAEKIISIFSDERHYEDVCANAFENLYVSWEAIVEEAYGKYVSLCNRR